MLAIGVVMLAIGVVMMAKGIVMMAIGVVILAIGVVMLAIGAKGVGHFIAVITTQSLIKNTNPTVNHIRKKQ